MLSGSCQYGCAHDFNCLSEKKIKTTEIVTFPHIFDHFPRGKVTFNVTFPHKKLLDSGKRESGHFEG